jgi:hypothetical protein
MKDSIKTKNSMKASLFVHVLLKILFLILIINLSGLSVCLAQCNVTTTLLNETFECPAAGTNSQINGSCTTTAGNGTQIAPSGYTNNSPEYTPITCKSNNPSQVLIGAGEYSITGNEAECYSEFSTTAHGGSMGMLVDGRSTAGVLDSSIVWCRSLSVTAGLLYQYSAWYNNPWNTASSYYTQNCIAGTANCAAGGTSSQTIETPSLRLEIASACSTGTVYNNPSTVDVLPGVNVWSQNKCNWLSTITGTVYIRVVLIVPTGSQNGNDVYLDDITFDQISGAGCSSSGCSFPTPVTLISFTARENNSRAALEWVTASEQNSSYFSVEKSTDGVNFTEIGTVNAQGNSSNPITYGFEDNHFNEASYYRLKMVDKDGTFKYSKLGFLKNDISVRVISSLDNKGELQIKAIVNEDAHWNLAVYSLLGQEYLNEKVSLKKGENTILKQVSGGEQSAKIVRIIGEDGAVILSEVVVW